MRVLSTAFAVAATVISITADAAIIVNENFESSSPPALPLGWTTRADPSITASAVTEASGGNPGKDLLLSADSSAATGSWRFEAIYTFAGPLPTSDLSQLRLTADLKASEVGEFYVFNIWSYEPNGTSVSGKADFSGLTSTTTSFEPLGGLLSEASSSKTLDTNASIFRIRIWLNGSERYWGFDQDNWLRFDNLVLATVPEPSTYVLAAIGVAALFAVKRRSRSTTRNHDRSLP